MADGDVISTTLVVKSGFDVETVSVTASGGNVVLRVAGASVSLSVNGAASVEKLLSEATFEAKEQRRVLQDEARRAEAQRANVGVHPGAPHPGSFDPVRG